MEYNKVIRERHATRKFSDRVVDDNVLKEILEAGRIAPTAKNIQPIRIYVVKSVEGLNKLDKATPCRYNSKTVLMVCGNKFEAFEKDGFSTYEMDSCIVATHMILEATNLGVDNIWIELFDKNVLKEEFGLEENIEPICLLPLGYEADDCPESPLHNTRKELDKIVRYC